MLKDIDIRNALNNLIRTENAACSYRLINELAICDGLARADIAVANGHFCGYEIKSDADSLVRLQNQVECYNKTFDEISLVVGEKFSLQAKVVVPTHWGIFVAISSQEDGVILKTIRKPKPNKKVDSNSLLELLWRSEVEELLRSHGLYKGLSGKSRILLRQVASDKLPASVIREYTRETIKYRSEWRTDQT